MLDPNLAIAHLAAWKGARIEVLGRGTNNVVYLVIQGNKRGVLKLDEQARERPFNNRREEAAVQALAANAGLAAQVIAADETMLFTEYVDGTTWQASCLSKDGNLERVAVALKKLHSLPLTGRSFDADVAARHYVARISGLDDSVVNQCQAIITGMRLPQNLCCCHNDLVAENIVATPQLKFLDWEYACDNDPFFDLATVVEHHQLSDEEAQYLLDCYFDGGGARWREQLEQQRKLYLALLCLWMAAAPGCDGSDLDNVVRRFATSCS